LRFDEVERRAVRMRGIGEDVIAGGIPWYSACKRLDVLQSRASCVNWLLLSPECERHSESGPLPPVRNCIYFLSPRPHSPFFVILSLSKSLPRACRRDLDLCPGTEIPRQARDDRASPFFVQTRICDQMIKGRPALPVNFAPAFTHVPLKAACKTKAI
jgi:hypothetical protein